MTAQEIKHTTTYTLTLDENEAELLMHVCWFALDYESEHKGKMRESEIELAKKIKEYFDNKLYIKEEKI